MAAKDIKPTDPDEQPDESKMADEANDRKAERKTNGAFSKH